MNKAKQLLEACKDSSNLNEGLNDIFPVKVVSGAIHAANGQTILSANREAGETPLKPVERDALIHFVADSLNRNKKKLLTHYQDYMKR